VWKNRHVSLISFKDSPGLAGGFLGGEIFYLLMQLLVQTTNFANYKYIKKLTNNRLDSITEEQFETEKHNTCGWRGATW
jgi:hypothetical protein